MIFEIAEFDYSRTSEIPTWLKGLPGEVKHFDIQVITIPPNTRRLLVVAMYAPHKETYYKWVVPPTEEAVGDSVKEAP